MAARNNAIRLLEAQAVPFEIVELPNQEKLSAVEVAAVLGVPPEQVFKTIVLTRPSGGRAILAVVPGPAEVDTKLLSTALREKKVNLPSMREAERLTGLQAGGISALALIDKGFDVVLDEFAHAYERIYVSGGQLGLDILLKVDDFIRLTEAQVGDIIRP